MGSNPLMVSYAISVLVISCAIIFLGFFLKTQRFSSAGFSFGLWKTVSKPFFPFLLLASPFILMDWSDFVRDFLALGGWELVSTLAGLCVALAFLIRARVSSQRFRDLQAVGPAGCIGPRTVYGYFVQNPPLGGLVDSEIPFHFTFPEYWNLWEAQRILSCHLSNFGRDSLQEGRMSELFSWFSSEMDRFRDPEGWCRVPEPVPHGFVLGTMTLAPLISVLSTAFSLGWRFVVHLAPYKAAVFAFIANSLLPAFAAWWCLPKLALKRQVAGWFQPVRYDSENNELYREVTRERILGRDRLVDSVVSSKSSWCDWLPFLVFPFLCLGVKCAGTLVAPSLLAKIVLSFAAVFALLGSVLSLPRRVVGGCDSIVVAFLSERFGDLFTKIAFGFWKKGCSLLAAIGRTYEVLRGRARTFTGFGRNKSLYKLSKQPMLFESCEFDRALNSNLIHGSFRRPDLLRRLKGFCEFSWEGRVYRTDYPIRVRHHLVDYLRRGGDPRAILYRAHCDSRLLCYFSASYAGTLAVETPAAFFAPFLYVHLFVLYVCMTVLLYASTWSASPFFYIPTMILAFLVLVLSNTVAMGRMCSDSFWFYLVPVFWEEVAKLWLGDLLGTVELFSRYEAVLSGNFVPFLPFMMHLTTMCIPVEHWWLRVVVHGVWNYFALDACTYRCIRDWYPWENPFERCLATLNLEQLSSSTTDITRIGQLILLAVERNFKQFLMSLYNFGYVASLLAFFSQTCPTIEDVVEKFSEWMVLFQPTAGEGIVHLLSKLLPKNIGRSPTVVAAIAISSCLMSSLFLGTYERLAEFLPLIDFSSMKTGEVVAVAVDASLTIVRSAHAAYQSGNLWMFFTKPKIFKLRFEIMKLTEKATRLTPEEGAILARLEEEALYGNDVLSLGWIVKIKEREARLSSEGELLGVVAKAMALVGAKPDSLEENIALRDKLRQCALDPALARQTALLTKIYERIEALEKNANASRTRRPPLVLVLLGLPGTGKTALYDQLIQFFAKSSNQVIDSSHVTRIQLEAKHPVEGAFPNTKVLIINDMVADHSKGLQTTSFSVGGLLQSIMDSEPLKFPSASVSSKGTTFPDVQLFIITTNERCFVMPENTERLQRRFDELAIIVDFAIIGDDERPMKEEEFALLDVRERNARTKVQLLGVVCTGKSYSFSIQRSRSFVPIRWFWHYVKAKIAAKKVKEDGSAKVMKTTCKCGVLHYSHYLDGQWEAITDLCEEVALSDLPAGVPICKCRLLKGHEHNPIWDHGLETQMDRQLLVKPSLAMPRSSSVNGRVARLDETSLVVDLAWYSFVLWGLFSLYSLAKSILVLVKIELERGFSVLDEVSARVLEAVAAYDYLVGKCASAKMKVVAQYLRARTFLRKYKYVIGLSSLALLAYKLIPSSSDVTAKIVVRENVDKQSMVIDSFTQEITYPPGQAEEWNKVPMDMPVIELSKPGSSLGDLLKKVQTNLVEFSVQDGSKVRSGYLLVINATLALSNVHYFFDERDSQKEVLMTMKGSRVFISAIDVFRIGKTECVLVRHAFPGAWRDLLPCFGDVVGVAQLKGVYSKDGTEHLVSVSREGFCVANRKCDGPTWRATKEAPDGECGNVIIGSSTKGSFILGNVSFREASALPWGPTQQGGCVITRDQILATIDSMREPVVRSFNLTCYESELENLKPLPMHSSFRTVVSPFLQVLGSKGVDDKKFNSSLKETGLAAFIRSKGLLSKKYGIPRRISKVENGVFLSAFMKTIAEINYSGFLPSSHLRDACHDYLIHVLSGVRKQSGCITLSPLSLEDSFFGQSAQNVTRANFKSSIGPEDREYFSTRNDLFEEVRGQYVLASSFREKLQLALNDLRNGDIKTPWVSGAYKDEIRSEEKLNQMAIRLFYTVDIYNNTLARMYLVPLASCLLDHPFVSRCFGKMNSGSHEWDDFYQWLRVHPNVLDLDFKHYDISHAQRIMREVAYFFYRLALEWYKDEESAFLVYLLVFALSCQLFEHKGDFALKFKGLPSGHIVTLILNCVANVILMITAFKMFCPGRSFWEETRGGVVGDDNVTSVSDSVKEHFNLVNLVQLYSEWGYEITDAMKTGTIQPFTTWENVQFLKRRFRYDEEIGSFVAPLEKDSIYKMLSYWTAKGSGTSYEQRMSDCFDVAQREIFLWGRREFEAFQALFKPEVDRQSAFLVHWFNFDDLVVEYNAGSEAFMHWTSREFATVTLTSSICTTQPYFLSDLYAAGVTLGAGTKYADSWNLETSLQENFCLADLNQPVNILTVESHAPNDAVAAPEHEQFRSYKPNSSNTFVADEYSGFATQPVLFAAANWTTTSLDTVISQDLFKSYVTMASGSTYLWRKLANFMFVDSALTVTVVVQGSSVAQGKILYSFDPVPNQVPAPALGTRLPEAQKTRAFLLPHLEINPAESKTYTIDLPAPTVWGVYSLSKGGNSYYDLGSYRMKQHIINPLGSGTDTVPEIGITIYLSLKGGSMSSKTVYSTFTSLETEKASPSGGVLSRFFRKGAEIASYGKMVPIPAVSEASTLFSTFATGTADLLSWFGFSKPLIYNHQYSWIRAVNNLARVDGNVQSELMSWRSNNSVSIAADSFPLGKLDDLVVSNLCAKDGLVLQFNVPTSATPDTRLAQVAVHPTFSRALDAPAITDGYELTPLGFCSFPFQYWRGDLVFTFESVCSVFHRATILILYEPVNATLAAPYIDKAPALQHWTMAVNGSSKMEIKIPWKQIEHFKDINRPSSALNDGNGLLTVVLLNAVTTNGSTDPIMFNVFVRGEDMAFGSVSQLGAPTPIVLTALQDTKDVHFFGKYFGEEHPHTVKEMASRFTFQMYATVPVSVGPGLSNSVITTVPSGSLLCSTVTGGTNVLSLVDYLSAAYVGSRGSYNYIYFPDYGGTKHLNMTIARVLSGASSNAVVATSSQPYPALAWGPLTYSYHNINPSIDVTMPHYFDGLFRPTYYRTGGASQPVLQLSTTVQGSVAETVSIIPTLMKSGGDDFTLLGFRGLPAMIF